MIAALEGTPIPVSEQSIIMMVNGVGYDVYVTKTTRSTLHTRKTLLLHIHTVVKQDAIELFGFSDKKELALFTLLLDVSGVGPKIALAIVDFGTSGVLNAISNADVQFFTQIPKVGKKGAQKIIIELKNKVGSVAELDLSDDTSGDVYELIETLTGMGFSRSESHDMVKEIPADIETIEEKIRHVLRKKK